MSMKWRTASVPQRTAHTESKWEQRIGRLRTPHPDGSRAQRRARDRAQRRSRSAPVDEGHIEHESRRRHEADARQREYVYGKLKRVLDRMPDDRRMAVSELVFTLLAGTDIAHRVYPIYTPNTPIPPSDRRIEL